MYRRLNKLSWTLFLFFILFLPQYAASVEAPSSIKAVLFYPAFCDECTAVIDDFLLPLSFEESDSLRLFPVDITEPPGDEIFSQVVQRFEPPAEAWSKPALLAGNRLFLGEAEITSGLPALLTGQSTDELTRWPDLPGLERLINGEATDQAAESARSIEGTALVLTWSVMAGLLFTLIFALIQLTKYGRDLLTASTLYSWSIPLFALIGLAIGIYLSYVTLNNDQIMCGPIGDCMAVQSSPHARLFGIPMAVWGVVYYLGILLLWSSQRFLDGGLSRLSLLALAGFSLFGVLFSIYLTSLELFVIHAVCLWCLTSAVLASLILITVILKTCGENACTRSAPQG